MYIWAAINVDNQLQTQKRIVKDIEKDISFNESNVSLLPLHISLKISTEINEEIEDEVRKDIADILRSTPRFNIDVEGVENSGTVVWIKMKENNELKSLHEKLCVLFKEKFNVPLHQFDDGFVFHSTLFLDSDVEKIKKAYMKVKNIALPQTLVAQKFIIGSSKNGEIGTYSVDQEIDV